MSLILLKEHPALRQLDDIPKTQGQAAHFTILEAKDSQSGFDEVWTK
jgi:kinetochore protein Fta7